MMTATAARLKAAEAMIDRLRQQLEAAHETIGRLESELAQVARALGHSTTLQSDDFCSLCGCTWRACFCDRKEYPI